jgi:MoaA/NifB/PqqE/SkfB family radical SAM enzyme
VAVGAARVRGSTPNQSGFLSQGTHQGQSGNLETASPLTGVRIRRRLRFVNTRLRELRMIAKGLLSARHPVLVHLIPIRRCNLSCAYCNEFDAVSKPVPTDVMIKRVDRLASFGTTIITLSGGEPLLHPELEEIIRRIRRRGILAGMITNGYLLTPQRIEWLNRAGLDHLQISIDNVMPDEVSKKSLKVLDRKLQMLAEHAIFHVNINSVIGSAVHNPEDALIVARRALALGFTSTVGILHDHTGQLQPLSERQQEIYSAIMQMGKRSYSRFNQFQRNIARGFPNDWRCRAGSRYLYVCEDGLVHYCSQQRGFPAIPLEKYSPAIRDHEYHTQKSCAPRCTVSCVQQVAMLDNWRAPQTRPAFVPIETLVRVPGSVSEG